MENRYNLQIIEHEFKKYLFGKKLSTLTIKNYLSDIRHLLSWILAKGDNRKFNPDLVESYVDYLKNENIPRNTINRRLSSIRSYFDFLGSEGFTIPQKLHTPNLKQTPHINKNKSISEHSKEFQSNVPTRKYRFILPSLILKPLKFLLLSILIVFIFLSYTFIAPSISTSKQEIAVIEKPEGRVLLFSGTLKNTNGVTIDTKTDISFALYKDQFASEALYTGYCKGENGVTPDLYGDVTIEVGKDCGMLPIPHDIFWKESNLYLGVTVGADTELTPRKQIPTTSYALNTELLQGLSIGGTENSVPYINENGVVALDAIDPIIASISEDSPFTIESAQNLVMRSGIRGDVLLEAPESGNISMRTGGFSDAPPQLYISSYGNVGVGSINPEQYKLQIAGDIGPDADGIYDLGSTKGQWSNIHAERFYQNGALLCDSEGNNCPFETTWITTDPALYLQNATSRVGIGTADVNNIQSQLYVTRDLTSPTGKALAIFDQTENQDILTASASGSLRFVIKNSGNTGIGTINPTARLDVSGGQTKIEVSTQYTQRLCHSGEDRTTSQNVLLGDCDSTSADLAEYYGTEDPSLAPGEIVSPGKSGSISTHTSKAYVEKSKTAYSTAMIGVVSTRPYDAFGDSFSENERTVPIALAGRVPVKISSDSADINPGDPITSSEFAGLGMKANAPGRIIGIALQSWNKSDDTDMVLTFVNPTWYDPYLSFLPDGDLTDENTETGTYEYLYNGRMTTTDSNTQSILEVLLSAMRHIPQVIVQTLITQEKIVSPLVETRDIVATGEAKIGSLATSLIKPAQNKLTIDLDPQLEGTSNSGTDEAQLTRLIIQGLNRQEAASFDSAGNATIAGTLNTNALNVANNLTSDTITSNNINSATATLSQATIAGTLRAQSIESETISQINSKIDNIQASASGLVRSLNETRDLEIEELNRSVNAIQARIGELKNIPLPQAASYISLTDGKNDAYSVTSNQSGTILVENALSPDQHNTLLDNLTVTNDAELYNARIANSLTAGSILVEEDRILSLSWNLNLSALSQISFFDGAVTVAKDGTVEVSGELLAHGGIKTNTIESLEDTPITLKSPGVIIANSAGDVVSSVDADGNALFQSLKIDSLIEASVEFAIMTPEENFQVSGSYESAINADRKAAGAGIIPAGTGNITIYTTNISNQSLIYLTPTNSAQDVSLSVVAKEPCADSKESECKPHFRVAASKLFQEDIHFNWLIIN